MAGEALVKQDGKSPLSQNPQFRVYDSLEPEDEGDPNEQGLTPEEIAAVMDAPVDQLDSVVGTIRTNHGARRRTGA